MAIAVSCSIDDENRVFGSRPEPASAGEGGAGTEPGSGGTGGGAAGGSIRGGDGPGGSGGLERGLGEPCSDAGECESEFCVDGVCCDQPCEEVCARCDPPDEPGACVAAERDPECNELACPESSECREYILDSPDNCEGVGACAARRRATTAARRAAPRVAATRASKTTPLAEP